MSFMSYSNKNHINIVPKNEFQKLTHEVFDVVATNLSKSLGPLGSYATILDGAYTESTKDGYTILSKYRFHNRYKRLIFNLIKAPCTKVNNSVGDGTTTVIALTNKLFNRYCELKDKLDTMYRLPREFTQVWDSVIDEITEIVKNSAIPIDPSTPEGIHMIYSLAYVSSNGNEMVSKDIADVYRECISPTIKRKDSPTNSSYIKAISGFEFPTNLISDVFVRNEDLSVTEDNVAVMIFDHKIETDMFNGLIIPLSDVMRARNRKLVIVAPYYDTYMCETYVEQRLKYEMRQYGHINTILTQYSPGKLADFQLNDLGVITRAKIITQDLANGMLTYIRRSDNSVSADMMVESILHDDQFMFARLIGEAASVFLSCTIGSTFKVNDIEHDERYIETCNHAKMELSDIIDSTEAERKSYSAKVYKARARIAQLEMKNFIYYVGANSILQRQILDDSIDDVIKCVRSAIEYGIVPGCQITIAAACFNMMNDIDSKYKNADENTQYNDIDQLKMQLLALISSAVMDVYFDILHGPDGMGIIKTLPRWYCTTEDGIDELRKEAIEKAADIVTESIKTGKVYDISKLEYSSDIVTSTATDMMVLSAASELVKILISGNQCILLDSDIDASHSEDFDSYIGNE